MHALAGLGITVAIDGKPNEIPDAIPFTEDRVHASYDRDSRQPVLAHPRASNEVFAQFRTGFLGKASPVHFFWGSFDLAVTRFSGRKAPRHPGGVPNLPDDVAQEAYSHEVSSAGFWPGGGAIDYPAYYSYAYPGAGGLRVGARCGRRRRSSPRSSASSSCRMTRCARPPTRDAALLDFLQSTYDAAADLGKWDRAALECAIGEPGKVRAV